MAESEKSEAHAHDGEVPAKPTVGGLVESAKKVAEAVNPEKPKKIRKEKKGKQPPPESQPLDAEKLRAKRVEIQQYLLKQNIAGKSPDAQILTLANEAVADMSLSSAQSGIITKKLFQLQSIIAIPDEAQRAQEIDAFFNQPDNWTQEVAPYIFEAQRFVANLSRVTPEAPGVASAERVQPKGPEGGKTSGAEAPVAAAGGDGEAGGHDGGGAPPKTPGAPEEPENYNPFGEFKKLSPEDAPIPHGMENFVDDWRARIKLIEDGKADFWERNVFDEERLKNDLKTLESLVRDHKVANADILPWQRTIRKYFRYSDAVRSAERMRVEEFVIEAKDIHDSKYLQSRRDRPPEPYRLDRYYKPEERKVLMEPGGELKWFKKYLLDKIAVPRAEAQPTFVEGIKLEDFEHFLEWKYGEDVGREMKHDFKRIRTDLEHVHVLNKMITTEGLSAEKLFEVFMQITPNDLDFLHEFKYVRNTLPIYENVVIRRLTKRRARYDELKDGKLKPEYRKKKGSTNSNHYEVLSAELRNKRIKTLEESIVNHKGTHAERSLKQLELAQLKDQRDEMNYGVGLWDDDWNYNATEYSKLSNRQRLLDRKEALEKSIREFSIKEGLSAEALEEQKELQQSMRKTLDSITEELDRYPKTINAADEKTLQYEGLSPIERDVADEWKLQRRLYWRRKGMDQAKIEQQVEEEFKYDGKIAVLMARYHLVYSRHIVAIGANYKVVGEGTKAIMRAPVLEDLERVYGWQSFFKRFGMGDKAGAVALGIFNRETQLHERGENTKIQDTGAWNMLLEAAQQNPEARMAMDAIKNWEDQSGISFAQILNNEVFKTGGIYDGSVWRAEIGVTDETRRYMQQLVEEMRAQAAPGAERAVVDNQGLAFQFGAESIYTDKITGKPCSRTDKNAELNPKRLYFLEKMRLRDPLLFMENMVVERAGLLQMEEFANVNFDTLGTALTLAQNDINTIDEFKVAPDLNLGKKTDFDRIVAPYLKELGVEGETQLKVYRDFIQRMQEIAAAKATEWAKTDFPLTLRIGDVDWEKGTSFQKIGILAIPRRGRDNVGMYKATEIIRSLLSDPELLFAVDPMKVLDKLVEMKNILVSYTGYDAAEAAARDGLATYLRMNESRIRRTPLGWAPGGFVEWGLRQLSEVPEDVIMTGVKIGAPSPLIRLIGRLKGVKSQQMDGYVKDVQGAVVKLFNGRSVSYAVEYGSIHGNAFGAKTIADIIATAQDRGLFLKHKDYARKLMQQFGVLLPGRILDAVRKYYWVVFVAILAAAVSSAMEDEKKHR